MNTSDLLTNRSNPQTRLMEETRGLVAKWDATGLLEGLKNDIEKSNMSVLLENQAKQIIEEQSDRPKSKLTFVKLPVLIRIDVTGKRKLAIDYFNREATRMRQISNCDSSNG